jgi:uncharacterized membrane protein YGL010W
MNGYVEHHLYFLARNRVAHRDWRNRAVHLVATIIGFCTIVSMLARIALPHHPACNLGLLLAVGTTLYYVAFEPLATAIVTCAWITVSFVLGPDFGQTGRSAAAGIGVPLGIFLAFNLTGVWTHSLFNDPIIDDHAVDPIWKRLLETLHTILFSSVQFVTFALLDAGYRPELRAQLARAERAYSTRRARVMPFSSSAHRADGSDR